MPSYPSDNPKAKHDLVTPRLPSEETLLDTFGIMTASTLFQKIAEGTPPDLKLLASVYSYGDGPHPPLSRALYVIGTIPDTHAVMRKLIGEEEDGDELDQSLHRCTLAVKRADGDHYSQLEDRHRENSVAFAQFIHRLRNENVAAVLAQDKYGRMGILKALRTTNNAEYQENDFHVACYVGKTEQVKDALRQAVAPAAAVAPKSPPVPPEGFQDEPVAPQSPPPPPGGFDDDGPVWNPDEDEPVWQPDDEGPSPQSNNNNKVSSSDDAPVWRPDDSASNNASTDLWEAPDGSSNDPSSALWEAAASSNDASDGLWNPPGVTAGDTASTGLRDASGTANENGTASEWDQVDTTSRKRGRSEDGTEDDDNGDEGDKFHADTGAAAADRFYSNLTRNQGTRADSRLYHMRAFNGWVKATQIQELDPKTRVNGKIGTGALRILDLACGKGGDLTKWVLHPRGIANYVGSDVARGSLVDAALRARKMRHKMKFCTFSCADLGHDVPGRLRSSKHKQMQKLLTWSLQNESPDEVGDPEFKMIRGGGITLDDRFDVVSIQFAIHYMMQTKSRARRFFRTVSQLLDVGGNLIATTIDARVIIAHLMNLGLDLHFDDSTVNSIGEDPVISVGGGACRIKFEPHVIKQIFEDRGDEELPEGLFGLEYTFTLVEGSDHGAGVGDAVNLPEWLTPIPMLVGLAKEAGMELEYAQNFHEFYKNRSDPSTSPAAHTSLYNMKVLNKNGSISKDEWEISRLYMAIKFRKVREPDETPLSGDEEEEDEIDPAIKEKFLPMAMMKAKKAAGQDWAGLSSDEKEGRIEVELKRLAKAKT